VVKPINDINPSQDAINTSGELVAIPAVLNSRKA
jgi:hypothetical protein